MRNILFGIALLLMTYDHACSEEPNIISKSTIDAGFFFPNISKVVRLPFSAIPVGKWKVIRTLSGCSCTTVGSIPEVITGGSEDKGGFEIGVNMGGTPGVFQSSFGFEVQSVGEGLHSSGIMQFDIRGRVEPWVDMPPGRIAVTNGEPLRVRLRRAGRVEKWNQLRAHSVALSFSAPIEVNKLSENEWELLFLNSQNDFGTLRSHFRLQALNDQMALSPEQEAVVVFDRPCIYSALPRSLLIGAVRVGERVEATTMINRKGGWGDIKMERISADWDDKNRVICNLRMNAQGGLEMRATYVGAEPTGSASGEIRIHSMDDNFVFHIPYIALVIK